MFGYAPQRQMLPLMRSRISSPVSSIGQCIANGWSDSAWLTRAHFVEHGNSGTDLSGGAVTALEAVMIYKGGLHRMEVFRSSQALDSNNLVTFMCHGKTETGVQAPAIDQNSTRSALAMVAAFLGSC